MFNPNENSPGGNVFTLPSAMTIETVESVSDNLKQMRIQPPTLVLNAAQTEILTTPGIQLLLSLAKTLQEQGIALVLTEPRAIFAQSFEQLGLAKQYASWEAKHD